MLNVDFISDLEFLETLNTADVKELQQLQKVGVKRAQMIFDYRQLNGPFDFVSQSIPIYAYNLQNMHAFFDVGYMYLNV